MASALRSTLETSRTHSATRVRRSPLEFFDQFAGKVNRENINIWFCQTTCHGYAQPARVGRQRGQALGVHGSCVVSALPPMPVFVTVGFRQSVIQQTNRHLDSSGKRLPQRFSSSDGLHPSCVDGDAVQQAEMEGNLHALLGPAAVEAAKEEQRAANRAVKAFARPPWFALDDHGRSTSPSTASETRFSQQGRASICASSPGLTHGSNKHKSDTCMPHVFSFCG